MAAAGMLIKQRIKGIITATRPRYGACMIIGREMTPEMVQNVVFPHPTVSEIIKERVFQTEKL